MRGDFWDRVVVRSADDNKSGMGMLKDEMLANASTLVLGGSETTATVLSYATYFLLRNPEALRKVTAEVRSAFSNTGDITLFSVSRLRYMLAVLDEAQRMNPAVPLPTMRVPPKGGAEVCGKLIPENTTLGVNVLSACRMPSNFHRPDDFVPERFLRETRVGTEFASDNHAVFTPFSVGTRNCIGRNLAYAEMRLILAKVVFHFDLALDTERTGNWLAQKSFGIWFKGPLYVKLRLASQEAQP